MTEGIEGAPAPEGEGGGGGAPVERDYAAEAAAWDLTQGPLSDHRVYEALAVVSPEQFNLAHDVDPGLRERMAAQQASVAASERAQAKLADDRAYEAETARLNSDPEAAFQYAEAVEAKRAAQPFPYWQMSPTERVQAAARFGQEFTGSLAPAERDNLEGLEAQLVKADHPSEDGAFKLSAPELRTVSDSRRGDRMVVTDRDLGLVRWRNQAPGR